MPQFIINYKKDGRTVAIEIESEGLTVGCPEEMVACSYYGVGLEGRHDHLVGRIFGIVCSEGELDEIEDERRDSWTPTEDE